LGYAALGIIYVVLLAFFGVRTFRNRRWILFALGFLLPLLWIIGGTVPPKGKSRVDALYEQRDRSS